MSGRDRLPRRCACFRSEGAAARLAKNCVLLPRALGDAGWSGSPTAGHYAQLTRVAGDFSRGQSGRESGANARRADDSDVAASASQVHTDLRFRWPAFTSNEVRAMADSDV